MLFRLHNFALFHRSHLHRLSDIFNTLITLHHISSNSSNFFKTAVKNVLYWINRKQPPKCKIDNTSKDHRQFH
ncbi:putative Sel1-like repeat-containing protein C1B3.10c [Dirofilaria immitis]